MAHDEAEDRCDLPMTDIPSVQTSSFENVCYWVSLSNRARQLEHDLSLELDPAAPYNERQRQTSFKPRVRSISEQFQTSDCHEDSFQIDQQDRSLLLDEIEIELDFDEMDDMKMDGVATLFEVTTRPLTEGLTDE